jgi:hypothetical protein
VSMARSYAWRRVFNHRLNKNNKKARHEKTDRSCRTSPERQG